MPCTKCKSEFNLFNWKIKCGECEDKYCNKCLKRREGNTFSILYCEKCIILLRRPPDRTKLMGLKSKDLQDYLNKRNISTYGLVEKRELVDLLCNKHIPEKPRKGVEKLTANYAGSVPNLRPLNEFLGNLESVITSSSDTSTARQPAPPAPQPPSSAPPSKPPSPQHEQQAQAVPDTGSEQAQPTTSQESQETDYREATAEEEQTEESASTPKYPKIEDFGSAEELQNLSSKDLKILLTLHRVDFRGCVEKSELLERAERLWEDNAELKKETPENLPVQDLCKLCMDAPLDCVLLECGHIATCTDCGKKLAECPICRQYVVRVVRTFKA